MTETLDSTTAAPEASSGAPKKRGGGLNSMLIADLKSMAAGMGIAGAGSLKKAQLVDAIKAAQSQGGQSQGAQSQGGESQGGQSQGAQPQATQSEPPQVKQRPARQRQPRKQPEQHAEQQAKQQAEQTPVQQPAQEPTPRSGPQQDDARGDDRRNERPQRERQKQDGQKQDTQKQDGGQDRTDEPGEGSRRNRRRRGRDRDGNAPRDNQNAGHQNAGNQGAGQRDAGRDRDNPRARGNRHEPDTTILEDDVLVPAAGILDVLDNYAFVRTSGYLPGNDDVYVSLSMVRKYGLRRGDAVIGEVRQPREGESRAKFNPMVRIESVNGADP